MQEAVRKDKSADSGSPDRSSQTLDWLQSAGRPGRDRQAGRPRSQVTGLQKHMDGGCPVLFNNVKGKPNHRVVTNLFGDMNVINKMFGWKDDVERTRKLAHALSQPIKPVEIAQKDAPCQEVVIENPKDVNEYMVPIRHTTYEPELTVGSGIRCVTGEQFEGGSDLGYNRMNFRWGNVGTFQISPGSHMWQVVNKYYKANERVPITMCFGVPPACTLLAGAAFGYAIMPQGCDEIGIAGAVQGSPIRLVKARTVDAMALADAEVVLEGYVDPRDRRFETKEAEDSGVQGRHHFHPEWAGYMGKAYKAPTFHVTAVTMRKPETKPIIFALGVHMLDEHNIDTTVREATIFELCNRLQPGIVQDVVIPYCMTDWGGCIIQVKKRHQIDEGWQRNFLGARFLLAGHADRDRGERGRRPLFDGRRDVVPHHARQSADRHPQPDPRRTRPDLHAGRAHDRRQRAMDRVEHALRGRHGHRCHGAVRLRERLPAPGLSGRQGEARGLLHSQEGHRQRQVAHARLGAVAGIEPPGQGGNGPSGGYCCSTARSSSPRRSS
jgi:gallate decarboxylase subunit C